MAVCRHRPGSGTGELTPSQRPAAQASRAYEATQHVDFVGPISVSTIGQQVAKIIPSVQSRETIIPYAIPSSARWQASCRHQCVPALQAVRETREKV